MPGVVALLLLLGFSIRAAGDVGQSQPRLLFSPPTLIHQAGPKAFAYSDEGFALDQQHIWVPRESDSGPPFSDAPVQYVTADGGRHWRAAPDAMPFIGSPVTVTVDPSPGAEWPVRDLGQRLGWEVNGYPPGQRISKFVAEKNWTTHYGYKDGEWRWKTVNETVTFDLSPHFAWATTKSEGRFAFNLAQCSSVNLPDGSILITAAVQWGQGDDKPGATKTAPVSLVAFRGEEPFLDWKFRGVVANTSQFPSGFHGYGEGPNENTVTLLPSGATGGVPTLLVVFRDDDQLGRFNTDACNYTSVRSTDMGVTWGEPRILPAGTVCPVLLPLQQGQYYLLSGGRENAAPGKAMAAPGCRTAWDSHCANFDIDLWLAPTAALLCGTDCSERWTKYSISAVHNRLLPASTLPSLRFTAEVRDKLSFSPKFTDEKRPLHRQA